MGHVAVGDGTEGGGPFVVIGSLDGGEGFADVGGVEADKRIHAVFGALESFSFDFVEGAFFLFLRESKASGHHKKE